MEDDQDNLNADGWLLDAFNIGIVKQNLNGEILHCNKAAQDILGLTLDQMKGRTSIDPRWVAIREDHSHFPGEEHPAMITLKTGKPQRNIMMGVHKPDGKLTWININTQKANVNSENEALDCIISSFVDVTERKTYEDSLLSLEKKYHLALTSVGDNTWEHDFETEKTWFSESIHSLLGFIPEEIITNVGFWWSHVHPDDRNILEENDRKYRDGLISSHSLEYRVAHKDGKWLWVLDRGYLYKKDAAGKPLKIIGTHKNITDRKKAEDELKQAVTNLAVSNKDLENFAYVASHDLQEPLRMVTGFLQLLEKKYTSQLDETAMQYIKFAVDGAERMKMLISDLLALSHLNKITEDKQSVNCNDVLKTVLQFLQPAIEEQAAEVIVHDLPTIRGYALQLEQLFQNLISNALKYRRKESLQIDIGCLDEGSHWKFFVKDNGIGIDEKYFDKIFVMFQRLHSRTEYSGTGIGLALASKIATMHGGQLSLISRVDNGSTFYFTIPKNQ